MAEKKEPYLLKNMLTSKDFDRLNTFTLTGNFAFDLAVSNGRGMPNGVFITLYAPKATGKTTICCDIAKRLLESHREKGKPYKVCYFDAENSMDLVRSVGLLDLADSGDFLYNGGLTMTFNHLEEMYDGILVGKIEKLKDVKLVIIDSISEITTQAMLEKDVEKGSFGPNQKACAEFLRKFQGKCMEKGLTTLVISHQVDGQNSGFGPPPKSESGGKAVGYSSSILLSLSKQISEDKTYVKKVKRKTIHGEIEEAKYYRLILKSTDKNRFGKIGAEVKMLIEPGKGCVNGFLIYEILTSRELIKSRDRGNKGKGFTFLDDDLVPPEKRGVEMSMKEMQDHLNNNAQKILDDYIIPKGFFTYYVDEEIIEDETY